MIDEREMRELLEPVIDYEVGGLDHIEHIDGNTYDLVFDGESDPNDDWIFDKLQEAGWRPDKDEWRLIDNPPLLDYDDGDDVDFANWHVQVDVPSDSGKSITDTTKMYMGIKLGGDPETVYREQFPELLAYMIKIGESASSYADAYLDAVNAMAEGGSTGEFAMAIYDAEKKHIGDAVWKFLNARPYAITTSLPLDANHKFFDDYFAFLTAQKNAMQKVVNSPMHPDSHYFDSVEEGVEYYHQLADEYQETAEQLQQSAEDVNEELAEMYG